MEEGNSILHTAVESMIHKKLTESGNLIHTITTLLKHGAKLNALNSRGETALYSACLCDSKTRPMYDVIKLLLKSGAGPNFIPTANRTRLSSVRRTSTLSYAARHNDATLVSLLIKYGAELELKGGSGKTALYYALEPVRRQIMQDLNNTCNTPALDFHRDSNPNLSTVNLLLDFGADTNAITSSGKSPFYMACSTGLTATVQRMLKCGAKVNVDKNKKSPLNVACEKKHMAVVELLLNEGADPNVHEEIADQCSYALHIAAAGHSVELVTLLLKQSSNVNVADASGNTALHHVIKYCASSHSTSHKVALHTTYEAEADVNICNKKGESVGKGLQNDVSDMLSQNTATLDFLLASGADVNVTDNRGMSPLFLACEQGVLVFVKKLLSSGANPNLTTTANYPLLVACQHRHHEIVKLLLENGADVQATDEDSKSALLRALQSLSHGDSNPNLSTVNLLLDYGADTNTMTLSGMRPLHMACIRGLTATVQRMLKCGAKVEDKDWKSPLFVVCATRHMAIVELLLSEGANQNLPEEIADQCSFALLYAGHNIELVQLFLNHGANVHVVDASGNTALHCFILHCEPNCALSSTGNTSHKVVFHTLLQAGADVNVCNSKGESSLYLTVGKGMEDDVTYMLLRGGNPNFTTMDKFPLCVACEMENLTLVEILLKAGAHPNLTAADTDSQVFATCELPLCIAAKKGNQELTELLLNAGAKANVLDSVGKSALHLALENLATCFTTSGSQEAVNKTHQLVKLLLEHGADVNQLMPDGRSPLSLLLKCITSDLRQSVRGWIQYKQVVDEAVKIMMSKDANLADSSNNLGDDFIPGELSIIESLCDWRCTDRVVVDLLKAGAGFQLLGFYCSCLPESEVIDLQQVTSVRVCQAAIMAGYVPSTEELEEMQQLVSDGDDVIPEHVELLSWFNEDRQQAPSLMRQCRVAIRRQLSVASCNRTILPAIDQLPLPSRLQQYLKFLGSLTEIDLTVEPRNPTEEEPNNTEE